MAETSTIRALFEFYKKHDWYIVSDLLADEEEY